MFAQLVSTYHLHPIVDHFTIALLTFGIAAEILAAAAILLSREPGGLRISLGPEAPEHFAPADDRRSGRQRPVILHRRRGSRSALGHDVTCRAADSFILKRRSDYLSHAVLGQYLMYAFLILAAWRVMLELSSRLERTRIAFLIVAIVAAGALLYQGKTGGELVYEHGVGMARATGNAQQIGQPPEDEHTVGKSVDLTLVATIRRATTSG